MSQTTRVDHPSVEVGMDFPDDAAVYLMPGGDRLIQTVDVIAPIVNDPAMFGRIACANSLSDVYAMGGKPLTAMNIVCFPAKTLPLEILKEVINGANALLGEANCALVGGHTVEDHEFKFGFAVSGLVEGGETLSIDKARQGDVLMLTKPIGTGVINQALRKDKLTDTSDNYLRAQQSMATLNAAGFVASRAAKASACTDVTGFGLLGHAAQFAHASNATFEVRRSTIQSFDGVKELILAGVVAGRGKENARVYRDRIANINSDEEAWLLLDPQTSGGLLVSIPDDEVSTFVDAMGDWPFDVVEVGRVIERGTHDVVLV